MDYIEVKNLVKTFKDNRETIKAIDGISFSVKKGEIFGLLGPNGAGKTTIISILIGLMKRDSGSVSLMGYDLDKDLTKIKAKSNIVTGFSMIGTFFNVTEYLTYFALLYNISDRKKKVKEVIEKVELTGKEKKPVKDLSSGYKQRVLLAKALLNDPELIFMDEPTVGLDVNIAIKVRRLIEELKKKGTTIIFTSHNLNEVEQLCDRIALISNGRILQMGSIQEIKKRIRNNKILEVVCKRNKEFGKMMAKIKEVKDVKIISGKVIIEARRLNDVDSIMKTAINSDYMILSIRKIEPTLEEAFLELINGEK